MPTYDYACAACGHRFEVVHGIHEHGPEACPNCGGGPVRRAFAPPTIMFKGSGWAKVDRRPARTSAKSESGDEGSKAKPSGADEGSKAKPSGGDEGSKAKPAGGDGAATSSKGGDGGSGSTAKTSD
jgi:putative FmdB family regulatory protein